MRTLRPNLWSHCLDFAARRHTLLRAALVALSIAGSAPRTAQAEVIDPLANGPANPNLFDTAPAASPVEPASHARQPHLRRNVQPANFQTDNQSQFSDDASKAAAAPAAPVAVPNDPCAAAPNKPLNQLGIGIEQPEGKLPTDLAGPCWDQINQQSGPGAVTGQAACGNAASRSGWPILLYEWDATCFCHQPLYFEEINLERYGYQYGDKCCCASCGRECCLQPAASAAHFFLTIPALPYCMAHDCPCDCIYTLGHYRPGSCPPWQRNYPPCDPVAAATTAGFYIGMAAAFP